MPDDIRGDDPYRRHLHSLQRMRELIDEGEFEAAREAGLKLRSACSAAGVRSGYVWYNLAIACDLAGDLESAFENIREAVAFDPLSLPFRRSYSVIAERIREALSDESRPGDDPSTPRFYRLLVEADEATNACHLAMARYLRRAGRHDEARRVLEAMVVLSPTFAEGWKELATLARETGDAELAGRAEAEASCTTAAPAAFLPMPRAQA